MPPNKLIHIVGGGFNQVPLVEIARAMGFRVLVTDMFKNPPARAVADHFEQIDTTNKEDTLKCAQKYGVDYVVTDMTDVAVPTVAYIAECLGLPGIGYETALQFTNKYVMRKALQDGFAAHLPATHYFEKPEDALDFYRDSGPDEYVVKPINSQGSRGVFLLGEDRVHSDELIYAAFAENRERFNRVFDTAERD